MPAEYCLKVRHSFSCAHYLRDYEGPCARMHGHDYKVEVEIVSRQLDKAGLAMDSSDIKKVLVSLTSQLDHRCANDIPPFTEINPSAENIAAWFFTSMKKGLAQFPAVTMKAVTIHETEKFSVRYTESV